MTEIPYRHPEPATVASVRHRPLLAHHRPVRERHRDCPRVRRDRSVLGDVRLGCACSQNCAVAQFAAAYQGQENPEGSGRSNLQRFHGEPTADLGRQTNTRDCTSSTTAMHQSSTSVHADALAFSRLIRKPTEAAKGRKHRQTVTGSCSVAVGYISNATAPTL